MHLLRHAMGRWRWAPVAVPGLGAAALCAVSWWIATHVSDGTVEQSANLIGLMSPVVTAVASSTLWVLRRARGPAEAEQVVVARLRRSIHAQWSQEFRTRQLFVPRPLMLRWRPTDRPGLGVVRPPRCLVVDDGGRRVVDVRDRAGEPLPLAYLRQLGSVGALLADDLGGWRTRAGRRLRRSGGPPAAGARAGGSPGGPAGGSPGGPAGGAECLNGALVVGRDDARPAAEALVRAMNDESVRQLVLLGRPGAGKTTLALLLTLAVLEAGDPAGPVPVLLSLAGWDPRERVEEWIAQQVTHDHPEVDLEQAQRLVADRMIMPVLDGLDEMPAGCHAAAMSDLERAAAAGLRTLITCRTEQYAEIVAVRGVLPEADVVDIEPITVDDAITYLTQREPRDSTRWAPVAAALTAEPHGLLASALNTPLMVSMAREVYRSPSSDPAELTLLPDVDTVRRHLLRRFLPSVYGSEARGARAERWLAFLVHTLSVRPRDPNLLWWRLGRAVPGAVVTAVVAATITVMNALLCPLLALGFVAVTGVGLTGRQGALAVAAGAGWGLFLGVLVGRQAARSARGTARTRGPRGWARALGTGVGDILVATAVLSLAGGGVLLVLGTVDGPAAARIAGIVTGATGGLLRGDPRAMAQVASAVLLGAIVVTVTGGLGTRQAGTPRRCAPRLPDLGPRLVTGVGIGTVIGLPWTAVGLFPGSSGFTPTIGLFRTAMVAGAIGIPLGVGSWLSRPGADDRAACSPESTRCRDRKALVASSVGISTITALFLGFFLWFPSSPLTVVSLACVGIGANVFAVVFLGSGAVWTSYTIARCWFALRGRLPWRLTAFLRHAHQHGVLRQAGAAYQIRHDLLRGYLEARWPAPSRR